MREDRIFDFDRAKHSVRVDLTDERCTLCGEFATHTLIEEHRLSPRPMMAHLCCEHFSFVVGDCSHYPYDILRQRA